MVIQQGFACRLGTAATSAAAHPNDSIIFLVPSHLWLFFFLSLLGACSVASFFFFFFFLSLPIVFLGPSLPCDTSPSPVRSLYPVTHSLCDSVRDGAEPADQSSNSSMAVRLDCCMSTMSSGCNVAVVLRMQCIHRKKRQGKNKKGNH